MRAIIGGVVVTVIGGLILYWLIGNGNGGRPPPPPPTEGTIKTPKRGEEVENQFPAEGTLANVPRGRHVWLAVQLDNGYLVPKKELGSQDRAWTRWISEPGTGLGPTRSFSLALLMVDQSGHQQIENWFSRGRNGEAAPAMSGISGSSQLAVASDLRVSQCTHDPIHTLEVDPAYSGGGPAIAGNAQITGLRAGDRVKPGLKALRGTYSGFGPREAMTGRRSPGDTEVWVVLFSLVANRYYPQTHREIKPGEELGADLLRDGQFRSSVSFPKKPGEEFEVLALVVNGAASQSLTQTLRKWDRAGDFPGLTELPEGVDEKDCVPVMVR